MTRWDERRPPSIRVLLVVVFTVFSLISAGIVMLLILPWSLPIPSLPSLILGLVLIGIGFPIMGSSLRSLRVHRALGGDIYKDAEESRLITTGMYAYTRNPLYFSAAVLFCGWTLIFLSTFLLIVTFLFVTLFRFAAKWEEKELAERFGDEYSRYKESVPFFFPRPNR